MKREKKKSSQLRWGSLMAVSSLMIILIVTASFTAISRISHMEEERSFERLYEEADRLGDIIEMYMEGDREELEMLAAVIADYDDMYSEKLWDLLDSYEKVGMMSKVELLLPDDTVLGAGGERLDADGMLSFEKEEALGAHITNRETDITDKEKYIVRHYVPVNKNGKTVAMLYGVVYLGILPDEVSMEPYSGKASVYIIDGNTGDFLVDTWHPGETGNIWELGEREMAPGYDPVELREGIEAGERRYVVFVSESIGEYLYFYYQPIEINEWRVAVSVPESVVFENANMIKKTLNHFLMLEIGCFILYFMWIFHYVRRATGEKQRQLDTLNYIYDVENLLFNAHEKQENILAALEKIGNILSAEWVGLWTAEAGMNNILFRWDRDKGKKSGAESKKRSHRISSRKDGESEDSCEEKYIRRLLEYFESGHSEFEAHSDRSLREVFKEKTDPGIHNMIAVPLEDMEGNICGILAGCNMNGGHASVALLKSMKFSFGMFCHNLKSFNAIRERGDRDMLTGVYNRNRYERDIARMKAEHVESLACVYVDVNGLHEMNNTQGHDKGDLMLQTVAAEIRKQFGDERTYRIGGDEFIAFAYGADREDVEILSGKLAAALEKMDYHISVGVEWEREPSSLDVLIKSAESKMYAEKKKYYAQKAHDRRKTARE